MTVKLAYAIVAAVLGTGFHHGFHIGLVNILGPVFIEIFNDLDSGKQDKQTTTNPTNNFSKPNVKKYYGDWFRDTSEQISYYGLLWSVFIAIFPIGAIFGGILVRFAANASGRRMTLFWSGGIALLGLIIHLFGLFMAPTTGMFAVLILLLFGRFFIGVYVGLNSGVCPIFLIEIAPEHLRGISGSSYNAMVSFGIFFAQIMTLPETTGTIYLLNVAVGVTFIPSILQMALLICVPESHKFLCINKEDDDAAEDALAWFRENWDVDDEMVHLREEATVLEELEEPTCSNMFSEQTLRSPLIICTVLMLGHQLCGAYAFFFYSNSFLVACGFVSDASYLTLGLGATNLLITLVAMPLSDVLGRKPLVLLSFAGMTFSTICLIVTIALMQKNPGNESLKYAVVVFTYIFIIVFAMGAGSVPWFLTPELHNHNVRPMATSTVVTVGWLMHFLFAMTCYVTFHGISYYLFIFYILANLLTFLFLAFTMRETMDLSSLSILELFYD